jgi:ribosome biogenesis GTPase
VIIIPGLVLLSGQNYQLLWRNRIVPSREEKAWQHYRARKEFRRVGKGIKRNRKKKRVRRKHWMPDDWDDLDDLDYAQSERIMPRGERERRRTMLAAAAEKLNEEAGTEEALSVVQADPQRGLVVQVSTSLCRVDLGGRTLLCALRGAMSAGDTGFTNVVAVGDEVVVSVDGLDRGVVEGVLPRRSALVRPDVFHSHLQQVIVANVDQLLVVSSWRDPPLWLELVDRYLITAKRNNLLAIICANKTDLAENPADYRSALQPYVNLGLRAVFTSALTGEGLHELRDVLRGRATVLAGMSGVGKSTLLAAVQPGLQLRTGEVNVRRHEGRHTTSQVTMLRLEMGGFVVDTPGIREFGLSGLRRRELVSFYPEILAAAEGCHFAGCSHTHEPGCALPAAVRAGDVPASRYHSYKKIRDTLRE